MLADTTVCSSLTASCDGGSKRGDKASLLAMYGSQ